MKKNFVFIQLILSLLFSGCFSSFQKNDEDSKILTHLVFCWLKDPGNLEHRKKIIEVTDSFNEIPSVINARAGNPIMSDRSIVDDSFDVGIIVEVRDEKGLKEYLGHPIHQKAKKDTLLPLVDRILVYDFTK